jgi:hypothetical protein
MMSLENRERQRVRMGDCFAVNAIPLSAYWEMTPQ